MKHPKCETCQWFDSSSHSNAVEDGGFCRVRPPVADDRNGLARWPTVDWNDWCADYLLNEADFPPGGDEADAEKEEEK